MVQKQAALSGGYRADSFADDDPLAELARIVGFEQPRPAPRQEPELRVPANAPPMNLEDELLREFETFEDPDSSRDVSFAAAPLRGAPKDRQEPVYQQRIEPVAPEPVLRSAPTVSPVSSEPFDWAAELAGAELYEAQQQAAAPARAETVMTPVQAARPAPAVEPARQSAPESVAEPVADLMDELEMAFAGIEPFALPASESRAEEVPPVATSRLSLPIANFQPQPSVRREPDPPIFESFDEQQDMVEVAPPLPDNDSRSSSIVSNNLWPELEAAFWTTNGAAAPQDARDERRSESPRAAVAERAAYEPAPHDYFSSDAEALEPFTVEEEFSFAEELAASEDFAPMIEPRQVEPVSAPEEASVLFPSLAPQVEPRAPEPAFAAQRVTAPAFVTGRSLETSFGASRVTEPVVARPRQVEPSFETSRAYEPRLPEPRHVEQRQAEPARPAPREPQADLMSDGEFELMLDDLDLDLSEFNAGDSRTGSASAKTAKASMPDAAPAAHKPADISSASIFGTRQSPPVLADVPVAAQRPVTPPVTEQRLPFDPLDIVETEDHPESIAMPDVPDVVVPEPEARSSRPDFEYDLDAELAGLLQQTVSSATPAPQAVAVKPATAKTVGAADDFDDFERALEEDFRRSLDQPQQGPLRGGRISINQLTPADAVPEGGRRWMLVASVAALVLVAGSSGAYFWLGGTGSSFVTSGEPRVIVADKDPIKVAPESPGGKSVPNQDKAVYDRVAGQNSADPKQSSLISSNEEPMDVVQRTLMPENLDNDEVQSASTPVGETEDPRLLPNGQETAAAAPAEDDQSAILPRKVRTMIVKPDGTLVAQEVPVSAAPVNGGGNAMAVTEPATPAPALAAPSQAASTPAPTAIAPVSEAGAPAGQTAPAVAAETAGAMPAAAPVPVARPSQQPVNVVGTVTDQGNVRGGRVEPAAPAAASQQAVVQPAAPAAAAAAASALPAGEYVIQIASLPSEAEAERSYRSLSGKFSNVIGGRGYEIRAAEVAGKGTYYRVRVAAGSKSEADALCSRFKSAGGSCLVVR